MRVLNLSRSPLEYKESSTLPKVRRIMSCGILARFSAQSVSMMPMSGESVTRMKPLLVQNSRSGSQTLSAGLATTSQRWLPWRSIFTSPKVLAAVPASATRVLAL